MSKRKQKSAIVIGDFSYEPGGKWDCGELTFTAKTPLGKFEWQEIIPGPRHGEDSAETNVVLNGQPLDVWFHDKLGGCGDKAEPPNFEAPGKPGRYADQFAEEGEGIVADLFEAWYNAVEDLLRAFLADKLALGHPCHRVYDSEKGCYTDKFEVEVAPNKWKQVPETETKE